MPKGPWGDGFAACEAYVMDKKNFGAERAKRYCGAIHQEQQKALPEVTEITPELVMGLMDSRLWALDEMIHKIAENGIDEPLLKTHILISSEMKARGIEEPFEGDALGAETRFWFDYYPFTARHYHKIGKVWSAWPQTIELPEGVTVSVATSLSDTVEHMGLRVNKAEPDSDIQRTLLTSMLNNRLRESTTITWDIEAGPFELKLYENGIKVETPQLFKSELGESSTYDNTPQHCYENFIAAKFADDEGVQVQPIYAGHPVELHKHGPSVLIYGIKAEENHALDPLRNEIGRLETSSLIATGVLLEDQIILSDLTYLNGEPLTDKTHSERFTQLNRVIPYNTLTHTKVVESFPSSSLVSTLSALNSVKKLGEHILGATVLGNKDGITWIRPLGTQATIDLHKCPYPADTGPCIIADQVEKTGEITHPIKCKAAAHYRCPYIRGIYYGEDEIK